MRTNMRGIFFAILLTGTASPLLADTIYDNSLNDLATRFDPGALEVGDEVVLSGTARYLTNFAFEFWGANTANPNAFSSAIEARVRFYQNDGDSFHGYPAPGTKFYDSQWFNVGNPTERSTLVFSLGLDFPEGGLFMPISSNMTWTAQFRGMGTTDSVGLDLYSPIVTGSGFADYWQNTDGLGTWQLMTNAIPMNFAAKFEASAGAVPEPSSAWVVVLGMIMLVGVKRSLRQ